MVLIIHDFSNRMIRFDLTKSNTLFNKVENETGDKIIWRGLAHDFTDEVAIKIMKLCKLDTTNIWDIKLWKLKQLYYMFIEQIEGKIDFYNGVAIDSKNKIKYILVLDMENILLLYAPYELSKTLENKLIKSDLTFHFITYKGTIS